MQVLLLGLSRHFMTQAVRRHNVGVPVSFETSSSASNSILDMVRLGSEYLFPRPKQHQID